MNTAAPAINTSTPTSTSTNTADPLAEAKLAVAHASAEISAIDSELNRLALAKAQATARFNFACARLAELQNRTEQA